MARKILFILFTLMAAGSALAEKTEKPVISWSFPDEPSGYYVCCIDVCGYGELMINVDGVPYDDEGIGNLGFSYYENTVYYDENTHVKIIIYDYDDRTIEVTATAQEPGKEMSDVTAATITFKRPSIVWGAFVYADGIDSEKGLQVHITSDPSYGYDFLLGEMVLDGFMYQINNSGEWLQYDLESSTIYLPEYGDYVISAYGFAEGQRSATATARVHYDAEGYTSYSTPRDDYYQYLVHNGLLYDIMGDAELRVARQDHFSGPCFSLGHSYQGDIVIPPSFTWEGDTYTVVAIGDHAFDESLSNDTTGVTCVTIPNTITSIGEGAFKSCVGLTSIDIPNSVTSIGDYAFDACEGLTCFEIPNSITTISNYMLSSCSGLTSIVIPNNITTIGERAFSHCKGLTSMLIPESVTSIGRDVFIDCHNLSSLVVDRANPTYDSRNDCNAIIETASNTLISGCMSSVIPNTVTSIQEDAFFFCVGLTSINIPNSVTSIGRGAFSGCTGLTSIDIPNSVSIINRDTFSHCVNLTNVNIPNSVTTLDETAFFVCRGLTSITIPESVTTIAWGTFYGCTGLNNVTCKAINVPAASRDAFYSWELSIYDQAILFVPSEALEAYQGHLEWGRFTHIVPFIGAGPGDINGDGNIAISDATELVDMLLVGEEVPAWADVNGDGNVSVGDITDLIDWLMNNN